MRKLGKPVAVGVDLGGTNVSFAACDRRGKVLARHKEASRPQEGPKAVIERMARGVERVLAEARVPKARVAAIGAGVPGPLDARKGFVFRCPNLPGFANVPLTRLLAKRTGLQVHLENDANAAALGEFWAGAGRGASDLILLTLGTGVGGGIILGGKLYSGVDTTAGELGHMVIDPSGQQCGCGQRGCLEQYASANATARRARALLESGAPSLLWEMAGKDLSRVSSRLVFEAARRRDPLAQRVWDEMVAYLAIGVANYVNIFNPQRVLIGGGVVRAGAFLLGPLRKEVRQRAFARPARTARILAAALGEEAGVLGAAALAFHRAA